MNLTDTPRRSVGHTLDLIQAAAAEPITRADALAHLVTVERAFQRAAWDDLRDRMPMLIENAHGIMESDSEMRAEYGMGYVCGGGSPGDAWIAYSMGQSDRQLDMLGEARRTIDERIRLQVSAYDLPPIPALDTGDDLPF